MYELLKKGLSEGLLSRYVSVEFTSDNKRDIYKDFDKILGLLFGVDYFYVIVFRNDKRHVHMIIRDCPFYKNQLKSIWTWIHKCPKFSLECVRDIDAISVYLSTQDAIEFVSCSEGWF